MTLQQLKYVVEVAERGSITEAAKSLFIAQPSLSAAIRDLEEETGNDHLFAEQSGYPADAGGRGVFGLRAAGRSAGGTHRG